MLYNELYLADTAAGAIAETFGSRDVWQDSLFDHRHGRFAIATFELDSPEICDLDDANVLTTLNLRPSRVVTRQRAITQAWSAEIFNVGGYDGISWWSYYDADWTSYGIWNSFEAASCKYTRVERFGSRRDKRREHDHSTHHLKVGLLPEWIGYRVRR
jgi:hypothetical protein